mmetsp:Transcript_18149/g.37182  ORF Transcript_18149/g.37182 Transcript_18149/m.37182 type:complete len:286 (-) Transcript_18149:274-1131(-)
MRSYVVYFLGRLVEEGRRKALGVYLGFGGGAAVRIEIVVFVFVYVLVFVFVIVNVANVIVVVIIVAVAVAARIDCVYVVSANAVIGNVHLVSNFQQPLPQLQDIRRRRRRRHRRYQLLQPPRGIVSPLRLQLQLQRPLQIHLAQIDLPPCKSLGGHEDQSVHECPSHAMALQKQGKGVVDMVRFVGRMQEDGPPKVKGGGFVIPQLEETSSPLEVRASFLGWFLGTIAFRGRSFGVRSRGRGGSFCRRKNDGQGARREQRRGCGPTRYRRPAEENEKWQRRKKSK